MSSRRSAEKTLLSLTPAMYALPLLKSASSGVLILMQNLKSAEEMEEEEKEAQSAKLQELIRRGTPHDLQEANRLMKVMAGFDTRSKTDYRAKAAEEVGKIQAKARLLEERLEAFRPGDTMKDGDVFSELASALQSAQPKIQKMCEEESDDHEAVAKLFEINDSIHRTVERYKLMKKGDMEGAAKVAAGGPAPSQTTTVGNGPGELSLIDFDEPNTNGGSGQAAAPTPSQSSGLENDLLGLDIGGESSSYGQGGGISLGFGENQSESGILKWVSKMNESANQNTDMPGPALLSSLTEHSSAKAPTPTPQSQFAAFSSPSGSQSMTPQPPSQGSQQSAFAPPQPANDPFAAFGAAMPSSRPAPPGAAVAPSPRPAVSNEDDEWNFSSALPPEDPGKPKKHELTISNTSLLINMLAERPLNPNPMALQFYFSNNTDAPVSELHFQLAVTKVKFSAIIYISPPSHRRTC